MSDFNIQRATRGYAIRLGDDALVLGQRLSEWCSNGPFLEEDLALSNVALDFIGRARLFYGYAAELSDDSSSEDDFAFTRDEREFRNYLICELPRGDFAYTMVRQLLIDQYNIHFLTALGASKDATLAGIAAKAIKESRYHLRRSKGWVLRLGDGTSESHQRTQTAVDALWGYHIELFEPDELEQQLATTGIAVDSRSFHTEWRQQIADIFQQATLQQPEDSWAVRGGRKGYHTENLGHLLTEMQFLHRSIPGQQW